MKKLTAAFVKHVRHGGKNGPDKYGDVHGLILRVLPTGSKQWIWRGTIRGRRVDLGMGGYPYVTLAEARQEAFDNRRLARKGGDPLAMKRRARVPTFAEAVEKVIPIYRGGWKSGSTSEKRWRATLETYAYPRLGRMSVEDITTADVMAILMPMWNEKRVTASRLRHRIGAVMKWAIAKGYRTDNPAGDAITSALPKKGKRVKHQRALPHGEVGAAILQIRECPVWKGAKLAVEFLILTAVRSGEARGARWDEIDLQAATWTIPGARMKTGREHRVPLSGRALEVLREARGLQGDAGGLVFPSARGKSVMTVSTLSRSLRMIGVDGTLHGMRSAFRDWCAETGQPSEAAEAALAHIVRNKVEAAYRRTDLVERRRELMDSWAEYLSAGGRPDV